MVAQKEKPKTSVLTMLTKGVKAGNGNTNTINENHHFTKGANSSSH